MVFDDTYDHEVWNQTEQDRAVLFIDIERPLKLPGRWLARFLVRGVQWTAYVQDARKNLATWEDRLEAACSGRRLFNIRMQMTNPRCCRQALEIMP